MTKHNAVKAGMPRIHLLDVWRTINQLKDLKDLIRHQRRWAHQIGLARPLKALGINEKDPHRTELIREKINNLMPIALMAANFAKAPIEITRKEKELGEYPFKYKEERYNILIHYDLLMGKDQGSAGNFDMVLDSIDQLIGFFINIRTQKLIRCFNPLRWIAWVLRLPITIIEYMGFNSEGKIVESILSIIVRILWAATLTVLTIRYSEKSVAVKTFLHELQNSGMPPAAPLPKIR